MIDLELSTKLMADLEYDKFGVILWLVVARMQNHSL